MPKVTIPPAYRGPSGGEAEVVVEGKTVLECLDAVELRHPGFREQVLDTQGRVHKFVNLFVNGEPVDPNELETAVAPGDEVAILAAIGGG